MAYPKLFSGKNNFSKYLSENADGSTFNKSLMKVLCIALLLVELEKLSQAENDYTIQYTELQLMLCRTVV